MISLNMRVNRLIGFLFLCLLCFQVSGQSTDSIIGKLTHYIHAIDNFSQYIPREKVYLHFDNTGYYQGDNIWFKCYIVASGLYKATELSKTLYVELLNPGGEMIDKRILKIEKGQCHGDFSLNSLPFYSGFYEVRAYTKYMLNFREDAIFSRLLPVFDKPKQEGRFEEKNMRRYGTGGYPMKREKPQKEKKVNLQFFPEGGNLVQGIESKVAFEATDAYGNPIEITGAIVNEAGEEITPLSVLHEGRGVLTYLPGNEKQKAVVYYKDKKYKFDMPVALPQGFVLRVDNLSYADSIEIAACKNKHTPGDMLGMAVLSRGRRQNFYVVDVTGDEDVRFKIDKTQLPPGVSQIVLFNSKGEILCDRLIFAGQNEFLEIKARTEKETYEPYELVDMEFSVTDKAKNPVQTTFSLSVKDGMNELEYGHNILTDLLLMSEIKGYVRNPSYYFEANDHTHRTALDLLLMVQGWRRYLWDQMRGKEAFELKYGPEQGIETQGQVVSFVKKVPKPNVDVSLALFKKGDEKTASYIESMVTDSLGRFSFISDVYGKWDMILAVMEKGKKKDYRIILDRLFTPMPKRYRYNEMQINMAEAWKEEAAETEILEDLDTISSINEDSLIKVGIDKKIHRLKEVVVSAKKRSREKDIYNNRSKSIAYYDVQSELDDIKDRGKYIGDDIHDFLKTINRYFSVIWDRGEQYVLYKGKLPLFVINYERTDIKGSDKYKIIRVGAIKSIYINEELSVMCRYADPLLSPFQVDKLYGCAVFIETYPEGMIPTEAGKGVRKTKLEGYSLQKEFYSPNYSELSPEPDYRRTLYWNPSVSTDKEGYAKIRFYNNSRCRKFSIDAESITSDGRIGLFNSIPSTL
ncbi:hypothetical protein [Parabacteroides sp. Marseille-P3160]|uniref:hypothetical protein n=1 Tax=Parabacteroides sp. Marseille-P3160 TaxID=1917887 RepID=UPI00350FD929